MQHKAQTEDQGIQKGFLEHGSPIPRLTPQLQHNPKPLLPVFLSTSHPAWTMQERDHNALSRDVRWDPRTQHCMGVLDACLTDAILSEELELQPRPFSCHIKQRDSSCVTCLLSD